MPTGFQAGRCCHLTACTTFRVGCAFSPGSGLSGPFVEETIWESYRYLQNEPGDRDVLAILVVCELKLGRSVNVERTARKLIMLTNYVQMHLWLEIRFETTG